MSPWVKGLLVCWPALSARLVLGGVGWPWAQWRGHPGRVKKSMAVDSCSHCTCLTGG